MSALIQQALALAEEIPRTGLHPSVLAWTENEVALAQPWAIAFSGGADSLALLLLVWAHWPEQRARLIALHFNHRLRGAASDGDEEFCRQICRDLGVQWKVARWIDAPAKATENAAREARHAFFLEAMTAEGSCALWTGHQKNDIAETHLMRLARGSGTAGLSAPRPVRTTNEGRVFLRPLLTVTKEQLQAALKSAGLFWREDATNASGDFFRNRIRTLVTPNWAKAAPNENALDGAALSRERLEEDDTALEEWLDELGLVQKDGGLDFTPFLGRPRALWRRALRRWTRSAHLDRRGFDELLKICERGEGRLSLGEGFAAVNKWLLRFESSAEPFEPWPPSTLCSETTVFLPDGAEVALRKLEIGPAVRARVVNGEVDANREAVLGYFDNRFTIRLWRPGDRFKPLGFPGTAKLQDLFVNRKVPCGTAKLPAGHLPS